MATFHTQTHVAGLEFVSHAPPTPVQGHWGFCQLVGLRPGKGNGRTDGWCVQTGFHSLVPAQGLCFQGEGRVCLLYTSDAADDRYKV